MRFVVGALRPSFWFTVPYIGCRTCTCDKSINGPRLRYFENLFSHRAKRRDHRHIARWKLMKTNDERTRWRKCRISNSRDQWIPYGSTFCFNIRNLSFNDYQTAPRVSSHARRARSDKNPCHVIKPLPIFANLSRSNRVETPVGRWSKWYQPCLSSFPILKYWQSCVSSHIYVLI